jgi:hypothetical protein
MTLQYITNLQGIKQAVIVPFDEWQALHSELIKLRTYLQFYDNLAISLQEALTMDKSTQKQQTLSDFLDEND